MQTLLTYLNFDLNYFLMNLVPVITALLVSLFLGFVIHFVYSRTFKGVVYNHSFSVSLALMTILTTVITLAISSNIALSLGMVGALSIVRYRAAIKDPMDLLFLFWAVTTGITTGARVYYLALIATLIVILALIYINRFDPKTKTYIIIVHYGSEDIDIELGRILRDRSYQIKSKTVRSSGTELTAEIRVSNDNLSFIEKIKGLSSVTDVTLVQYNGHYSA